MRANRAFLARAVRYLAGTGITQFLDIGTGLPASNNTHEVAQAVAPDARVVYVDYDPIVLQHARVLLTGATPGTVDYIDADVRDPAKILREARRTLDFDRPVALMMIALMHLITDADDPYGIVGTLKSALAPGSYLALSQVASDLEMEQVAEGRRRFNRMARETQQHRTNAEVRRFFDGFELIEPGVVQVQRWHPSELEARANSTMWCGVARKPA